MEFIQEYMDFLNKSTTPLNSVKEAVNILRKSKFRYVDVRYINEQRCEPGNYYTVVNHTLLIAFSIPVSTKGLLILATHNDSPVLKLRNLMEVSPVQPYGGGIWHTWFDRPLSVSGTVVDRAMKVYTTYSTFPFFMISSLPIHMCVGDVYKQGLNFDKETNLRAQCFMNKEPGEILDAILSKSEIHSFQNGIFTPCSKLDVDNIVSYEFTLSPIQDAVVGGIGGRCVFSGRQDNLLSTFCGLKAIVNTSSANINVLIVCDNEEIGSDSATGAKSHAINSIVRAITPVNHLQAGLIVSCDVAHGTNKCYISKYSSDNPVLGGGVTIKHGTRYATTATSEALFKHISGRLDFQTFHKRNDVFGGGTIGPMLCSSIGIEGIDIGVPILGMHSICETSNMADIHDNYNLFLDLFGSTVDCD